MVAVVRVEALLKAVVLNGDSAKHGPEMSKVHYYTIIGQIKIILLYNKSEIIASPFHQQF